MQNPGVKITKRTKISPCGKLNSRKWRKGSFLNPYCHLVIKTVRVDSPPCQGGKSLSDTLSECRTRLAEARKYRLCLSLSHQYIDQLPDTIRQAVFGNVGTLIAFRIGHADAEVMTKEFGGAVSAASLADLERYEAVVKLLVEG